MSDIVNHFVFGMGSINILWMLTDDYDNLFYQILPRDVWNIWQLDFLARLLHFQIYFCIFRILLILLRQFEKKIPSNKTLRFINLSIL